MEIESGVQIYSVSAGFPNAPDAPSVLILLDAFLFSVLATDIVDLCLWELDTLTMLRAVTEMEPQIKLRKGIGTGCSVD